MTTRPGTPEQAWRPWLDSSELRPFPDEPYRLAVVVAAHPDDEPLGVSGLLQHLHGNGTALRLVVATDGEAAFPALPAADRAELGRARRVELRDSLRAQGIADVEVHWLGLPDSGLARQPGELADRLAGLLADADVCLVPCPTDPHPDHQAVATAALSVAPVTTHRWSYPIWTWHRRTPADVSPALAFVHRLTREQRRRKASGIGMFVSRLKPGPSGEDPVLPADLLRHFERDVEIVFREPPRRSAPVHRFARLYADGADPWGVATKWYERRKRTLLLAALPDERYGTAVEPACGTGVLTAALADRCARVLAFDPVPAAVDLARARTADRPNVSVTRGTLPADLPAGPVDLVVFSEILYYLDDADLRATVDGAVAALRPGGTVVAAHWLPWAPEAPRDGLAAHRFLLGRPELTRLVEHVDERFVLHVLSRR